MSVFNNREIATGIWMVIVLVACLSHGKIRESLWGVVKAVLQLKLVFIYGVAAGLVALMVAVLAAVGFWDQSMLKDTIIWTLVSGIALVCRGIADSGETEGFMKKALADILKITIFMEFYLNFYTFSVVGELILLPVLALLAMMIAVAESDEKFRPAQRFLTVVQSAIGLGLVAYVISCAIGDPTHGWTAQNVRNICLPIILGISLLPASYVMALVSAYEQFSLRLNIGTQKPKALTRYAKRRLLGKYGLNLTKWRLGAKTLAPRLMGIQNREQLETILAEA